MINFVPAHKMADLYSDEVINEIHSDLKMESLDIKADLKKLLERSAQEFVSRKQAQKSQFTEGEEIKKLHQLAKSLNKSNSLFTEISETSRLSIFRFYEGLDNCRANSPQTKQVMLDNCYDGFFLRKKFISEVLNVLECAALEATKDHQFRFSKSNNTNLVLHWLWSFSDFWDEYSMVTLSEGRWEDGKYDSPAMKILDKIIAPLNLHLPDADRITSSQLAEAIKLYRDKKK